MIDFLKYRWVCLSTSLILLATGIVFYFLNGGFAYNIDFTGGTELRLAFAQVVEIADIRSVLTQDEWSDFTVQSISGGKEFLIRLADNSPEVEEKLTKTLKRLPNAELTVKSVELVGPEAGKEVRYNTLISIALVLLLLLAYISLRHRYAYALGAILALAHDLLVLATFYIVFRVPLSLNILAGILTVLGYSLNDTIVIFNQIKNNLHLQKTMSTYELINLSINQTLTRTILTSVTTFLSVLSLYILGGELLSGFAVTMMIAVIVGTYSSVYIASPVMMYFNAGKQI